ncbi:MAG: fibronectin type III domain-containing protein [Ruminococcaceae bacterium]|nr:fibronectin type III domain-containing protein [Oscillospiraceae bacterium]
MKRTKRILAMALVVVMLMSVMGVAVSAVDYYVPTTSTNYGYMAPTDAKGTKTVSTVKLYGAYDYIDFYISSRYADTYFFYEIYSSKNYGEDTMVDGGYFYCGAKGTYSGSALVKLSGTYKTGTYYMVTYVAKISSSGNVSLSEPSLREYKVVVNRTTNFKNQMVITKGVTNTVNGPQIKWQGVSSAATKYYIYRRPMSGTSWTKVGTAKATARSFVDTSVKNKNGKYVYTVKAVNKSNTATRYHYMGEDCLFAKAPTLKSVATGADNKIKIQWNSTSGSAYYEVYRREVGTNSWTKLTGNCKTTSFNDAKAVNGKTYEYTVRANIKTADGVARSSYYGNAGKAVKYLQAPVVNDIVAAENGLNISWKAVNGVTAYTVYRRAIDGSTGWTTIQKVSADTTSYVDATAAEDAGYIYTVRAEGPKGRGSYSTAGKEYLVLATPVVSGQVSPGSTEVLLSWADVPNAQTYEVRSEWGTEYEDAPSSPVIVNPYYGRNIFMVYAKATITDSMTGNTYNFISEPGFVTVEVE